MNKYWDITHILPYQRPFNFVVGPRGVGKTYTTQKWLLKQAIEKGRECAYITRTVNEQNNGGLLNAWAKVLQREYPEVEFKLDGNIIVCDGEPCVRALALSQAAKLKRISFPNVWYILFDEYQLEQGTGDYLRGYLEPELFIMLYHTIDREENRVRCFLLGNNTSYYNPYHMYAGFGLPKDPRELPLEGVWKNKVCTFENVIPTSVLQSEKSKNVFLQALAGTRYGDYATNGKYLDDKYTNLGTLETGARQIATFRVGNELFGLYNNALSMEFIFSKRVDPNCNWKLSCDKGDIRDGFTYYKDASPVIRKAMKRMYALGGVVYESMEVKAKIEPRLILVI